MTKARDIASAAPAPSTVSATELGYVDGVTSAIQTQLDAKTAKSTLTTTGDIYYASGASTPARLGIGSTGNVLTVASGIPSWAAPAGGSSFSGCRLTKSTAQSCTSNTFVTITFDQETFDVGGYHSTVTNTSRITIPSGKAGYYQVDFNAAFAVSSSGTQRIGRLKKNGSATYYNNAGTTSLSASSYASFVMTDVIYGDVGDYFEIDCLSSGATVNMLGDDSGDIGLTNFSMFLIGA
jgi:hypothetical protein